MTVHVWRTPAGYAATVYGWLAAVEAVLGDGEDEE